MAYLANSIKLMAAALLVSAFSSTSQAAEDTPADTERPSSQCQINVEELARQLKERDFPHESATISVKGYNDVMCEEAEDMANIVAVVTKANGDQLYGIFHIHATHQTDMLTSVISFNDEARWVPFTAEAEWKAPWCQIIEYVYEEDLEAQGCQKPSAP